MGALDHIVCTGSDVRHQQTCMCICIMHTLTYTRCALRVTVVFALIQSSDHNPQAVSRAAAVVHPTPMVSGVYFNIDCTIWIFPIVSMCTIITMYH